MKTEYERNEYNRREEVSSTTKLTYLVIGGGIGAILALLFAPKTGTELRGDIADATRKGIEKSKETAALVGEKAGDYYEVTREKAGELYSTAQDKAGELYQTAQVKAGELGEKAKGAVSSASNPFSAALEAGKEAYSQEKQRSSDTESLPEARPTYPVKETKALDTAKDKEQESNASNNSKDKVQDNKSGADSAKDKEKRG
jgi:gas vesicle protein